MDKKSDNEILNILKIDEIILKNIWWSSRDCACYEPIITNFELIWLTEFQGEIKFDY